MSKYGSFLREEDAKEFLDMAKAQYGEDHSDEYTDYVKEYLKNLPQLKKARYDKLALFQKISPDRYGKINLNDLTVEYDEEKYTEWGSNYPLYQLEAEVYLLDRFNVDYELRLANHVDEMSDSFTFFLPNDKKEKEKMSITWELIRMYESGKYKWNERDRTIAVNEEFKNFVDTNYGEAYYVACQSTLEFHYEYLTTPEGKKRVKYRAVMDAKKLEYFRKHGTRDLDRFIPAEKFQSPILKEEEKNGMKIYTMEFWVDEV